MQLSNICHLAVIKARSCTEVIRKMPGSRQAVFRQSMIISWAVKKQSLRSYLDFIRQKLNELLSRKSSGRN